VKLDFGASGFIDAVSEYWRGVRGNSGAILDVYPASLRPFGYFGSATTGFEYNKKNAYMESRARLKFDAKWGKELTGTIFFEFDSSRWGDFRGGSAARVSERNTYGAWNADAAAAEVKNIYIDAALPYMGIPIPMQVRVGLQGLAIRTNLLVFTDGMGVIGTLKIDPVNIQPIWFKAIEGKDFVSDDVDVWGLHGNAKIQTFTVGGYFLYYNMNTYPLTQLTTTPFLDSTYDAYAWWAGVYADGKAGPVNINFDFIYDRGKVEPRGSTTPAIAASRSVKYRGWVGYLKIDYPYDMFNFGVVGMYASGADRDDTSASGLPGTATATGVASHKVTSFVVPPGSESGAIFGESLVLYASWVNRGNTGIANTINAGQLSRGGVGGTWMAKVYGSYKATPWYKVTLAGVYIGDTTDNGDTFGNSMTGVGGRYKDNSTIGWEIDLYNEFQIYKQLKWTAAGGVMFAKDAFKFWDPAFGINRKPRNPWLITTNLTYSF